MRKWWGFLDRRFNRGDDEATSRLVHNSNSYWAWLAWHVCPDEQSTARAFATIEELCSISSHGSCFLRNCCIKGRQFCFILSSTKSKGGGSRTWKTGFEHNERTKRIFAFFALYVRSLHFSWEKIAQLLHTSVSTVQRRRRAFGISEEFEQYSVISDHELDQIYKEITAANTNVSNGGFLTPNIGKRRFIGALRSRGLRVQRWRVSNCLRRLDPVGTALRWRLVIYRRKYNVPTPNSLWHFDSAHKLIRWKLIVHVCIDGFSRLITHCRCATITKLRLYWDVLRRAQAPMGCHQEQDVIIGWRIFLSHSWCWKEEA